MDSSDLTGIVKLNVLLQMLTDGSAAADTSRRRQQPRTLDVSPSGHQLCDVMKGKSPFEGEMTHVLYIMLNFTTFLPFKPGKSLS